MYNKALILFCNSSSLVKSIRDCFVTLVAHVTKLTVRYSSVHACIQLRSMSHEIYKDHAIRFLSCFISFEIERHYLKKSGTASSTCSNTQLPLRLYLTYCPVRQTFSGQIHVGQKMHAFCNQNSNAKAILFAIIGFCNIAAMEKTNKEVCA